MDTQQEATHYCAVVITRRVENGLSGVETIIIPRGREWAEFRFPGGTNRFNLGESLRETAIRQADFKVGGSADAGVVKLGWLMHVQKVGRDAEIEHFQYFFSGMLVGELRSEAIKNDERDMVDDPLILPPAWVDIRQARPFMSPNHGLARTAIEPMLLSRWRWLVGRLWSPGLALKTRQHLV